MRRELNDCSDRSQAMVAQNVKKNPAGLLTTASGDPITILLVDDDPDCRMLLRNAIAESKVSNAVFEVGTGEEAMEFLSRRGKYADAAKPGLIYLDIEMPGMGGQETLKRIRAMSELRDIPIVM